MNVFHNNVNMNVKEAKAKTDGNDVQANKSHTSCHSPRAELPKDIKEIHNEAIVNIFSSNDICPPADKAVDAVSFPPVFP